ncbi:hypothetical protein [Streptomyces sp. NPDC020607]|uniref:hypothetical protein n=1 Tax=Streptomyces sp. NPDC020607 TaxID=3365082 RepID=UPI003793B3F8
MNATSGPVASMFSPEGAAHLLNGRIRGHLVSCAACRTGQDCDEGSRMQRALRAVKSVLKDGDPLDGRTQP